MTTTSMVSEAPLNPLVRALRFMLVIAVVATMAACASITAANGPYKVGKGYTVQLPAIWSDISPVALRLPYVRTLTKEGPSIDLLILTDAIAPGQALTRRVTTSDVRRGRTQIPVVRTGMNEFELIELVVDSLAVDGFEQVEPTDVTPMTVAGVEGVGFGYTAKTVKGLNIRGLARAMQQPDGKVYLMIFLAPEEHFYGQLAPKITQIFDSARF